MAEKNKKQGKQPQHPASPPSQASSNQLVTTSAASPVELINRYQVLGQIPKIAYNSALAYPQVSQNYTPINQISKTLVQAPPVPTKAIYPTKSIYIPKPQTTRLFYIEPSLVQITNHVLHKFLSNQLK